MSDAGETIASDPAYQIGVIVAHGLGSAAPRPSRRPHRDSYRSRLVPDAHRLRAAEFVAVDFETANRNGGVSACQIALVKVTDGRISDRYASLIKPPPGWDNFEFTYLHGIGSEAVASAPTWPELTQVITDFVGPAPVYAHNAQFDARVWRELDAFFNTASAPAHMWCTYRLARQVIPGLANYKLPTVVSHCAPSFRLEHHQADSDAEACALIVAHLQADPAVVSLLS